jgi:hypothetical protein
MKLIGRDEIPEPDTVGDWLRRMGDPNRGEPGLMGLDSVRDRINERILRRDGIKEYMLDADAMEIVGEKADALFTYKGHKGYMPVAGRIVKHAGETVLKLMTDLEKLELFKGVRRKSFELSLCPDG